VPNLLKVRLSLKGRPIKSYMFDKPKVTIGRDPKADIFLDNTGISRNHAVIERTAGGYVLSDLGSANGTFLNEKPVRKEYLGTDDVVHIGKFALWMDIEPERRERSLLGSRSNPTAMEGTMVIDPEDLLEMQRKSAVDRESAGAAAPPRPAPPRTAPRWLGGMNRVLVPGAMLALGVTVGWALSRLLRG